jgi:hypothetical protein
MPPAMGRRPLALACAVIAAALLAAGCSNEDKSIQGPGSPGEVFREGIAHELDGLRYNVFITRQLNLAIPPDQAYYSGPEPGRGQTFYGLFLQVCNESKDVRVPKGVSQFKVVDNQDNEFRPKRLPDSNAFAYNPRPLGEKECIPADGSVAQQGPTAGSMLLFEIPVANTENRPLELQIQGREERLGIELDL